MIECYGYCRVSGVSQGEDDKGGLPRQREKISAFAAANGLGIVNVFEDTFTGKELDRPAFRLMRDKMVSNGVRCVLIEKLDRLARDLLVQETILADFKKHGIKLLSTLEPDLCSEDPSRKFFRQIMGAVAEYDRAMLTSRMRQGKDRAKANGKRVDGPIPFGEDTNRPSEKGTVRSILAMRSGGLNLASIATELEKRNITGRSGKPMHAVQIQRILQRNGY